MKDIEERITSPTNAKIKLAASLKQRKQREKAGLFVAEGVRLAEMAVTAQWRISFALVTERAREQPRVQAILAHLRRRQTPVAIVSAPVYAKASGTEHPQGILLVLEKKSFPLQEFAASGVTNPCYAVLDGVQDPGNLGTILRTADAAGLDGGILLKGCVDAFSPKVVRASMGSLFHLPVAVDVPTQSLLSFLEERKIRLYATALDQAAKTHFAADYKGAVAIAFGNEGNGVSAPILAASDKIYVPMFGQAESLNVAISSAVVFYEVLRQRHLGSIT